MRSKPKVPCVYCGRGAATSRDHVIPKCLFLRPFPRDLITVPACVRCNHRKGEDDSFLRDYLTCDFVGQTSPTAQAIFQRKMLVAANRNSSDLANIVRQRGKMEPFYTRGGVYLGHLPIADFEEGRMEAILDRIIRGLYYYYRQLRIPQNYESEVWRIMPWDFGTIWETFSKLSLKRTRSLGDVFIGRCAIAREDQLSTVWLLTFYERIHFGVFLTNPELEARRALRYYSPRPPRPIRIAILPPAPRGRS